MCTLCPQHARISAHLFRSQKIVYRRQQPPAPQRCPLHQAWPLTTTHPFRLSFRAATTLPAAQAPTARRREADCAAALGVHTLNASPDPTLTATHCLSSVRAPFAQSFPWRPTGFLLRWMPFTCLQCFKEQAKNPRWKSPASSLEMPYIVTSSKRPPNPVPDTSGNDSRIASAQPKIRNGWRPHLRQGMGSMLSRSARRG